MTEITTLEDLSQAHAGSYYTIIGTGGDLQEWVDGYEKLLVEQEIGKPTQWFKTNGAAVNYFASRGTTYLNDNDRFKSDLGFLLFPLDGLSAMKLAMFKLRMEDRWFDDIVDNMRRRAS